MNIPNKNRSIKNLIEKNMIIEFNINSAKIPSFLKNLILSAQKIEDYMKRNDEPNISRHSRLEDLVLLYNKNILAIEIPIWDKALHITGHIDMILYNYNGEKPVIYLTDYKPNVKIGKSYDFVRYLPQVCMYGLLFKKLFNLNDNYEIKCLIFNKDNGWIFDADLIYKLREIIKWISIEMFLQENEG